MEKYSEGSAHGRFQPLHNDHLKYLLKAKQFCDFLWIGITQYDIYSLSKSPNDSHRQERGNNPLTYFERVEMITQALLNCSIKKDEFAFIPFPIENPERLKGFLPTYIPIFTTINDQWNEHKIHTLEDNGYNIVVLWEDRIKKINGMIIRELISSNDESWKDMVPLATIQVINKYGVQKRVIDLQQQV